eukprot:6492444-Amphidinium_carterae.1
MNSTSESRSAPARVLASLVETRCRVESLLQSVSLLSRTSLPGKVVETWKVAPVPSATWSCRNVRRKGARRSRGSLGWSICHS